MVYTLCKNHPHLFSFFFMPAPHFSPRTFCNTYRLHSYEFYDSFYFYLLFLLAFSADYGYDYSSMVLFIEACTTKTCVTLPIVNDDISERVESFYLTLETTSELDSRIILNPRNGEVTIHDDDGILTIVNIFINICDVWFVNECY